VKSWTARNQAIARTPTVVVDKPLLDQGETDASPNPDPSVASTIVNPDAAIAAARIAAQETAERDDSSIDRSLLPKVTIHDPPENRLARKLSGRRVPAGQ
jgi:hypothetical protein